MIAIGGGFTFSLDGRTFNSSGRLTIVSEAELMTGLLEGISLINDLIFDVLDCFFF